MKDETDRVPVIVPDLGVPSVEVGIWHAQLGDHVYRGDRIVEVLIGGATFDVTSPVTGEFVERYVGPHDRVVAGTKLGCVAADPES